MDKSQKFLIWRFKNKECFFRSQLFNWSLSNFLEDILKGAQWLPGEHGYPDACLPSRYWVNMSNARVSYFEDPKKVRLPRCCVLMSRFYLLSFHKKHSNSPGRASPQFLCELESSGHRPIIELNFFRFTHLFSLIRYKLLRVKTQSMFLVQNRHFFKIDLQKI